MKTQTRKATMTNRERVEALFRRERPDRVPFWAYNGGGFAMLYSGGAIADQWTKPKWAYEAYKKACHDFDMVFTPDLNYRGNRGEFGGEVKLPTSKYSFGQFTVKYAVQTADEAMALKAPDFKASITPEILDFSHWVYQDKDDSKPYVTFNALGAFSTAAGIAEEGKFYKWVLQKPEVIHHLCRLATDYGIATAQYYKDTFGVERVVPSGGAPSASNQLISPKQFEEFALPYYKEVHQKVMAMGFKHSVVHICGEHNLNLPYWQQVPMGDPGIVSVGDEVDLATAAKYFPNDIIEGNLNTTIIQVGTPNEVYEAARKVIEKGKSLPNGYILRTACSFSPRAPVENMRAITRAVNDFGWYD